MKHFFRKVADVLNGPPDIPLLLLRLILAWAFLDPALTKWSNMEATIEWFGNPDRGLGLPFPELNAYLAATTEALGVVLLALGFKSRWISFPLIITLLVALVTVHMDNGWRVIADGTREEISARLSKATGILKEHGRYDYLSEYGRFVILQNGMQFVVYYIAMLLAVIQLGSGRISLDYLIERVNKS